MSIELRRDSKGRARYVVRVREGGRNRARVFDRRQDAKRWEDEVRRRRQLGNVGVLDHERRTVGELFDAWRETHGADLSRKSLQMADGCWSSLIAPSFENARLSEVTPLAVEQWARRMLSAGRGEASVEKGWLTLSSMFRRAHAWGWSQSNPVRAAQRPRKRSQRREPVVLTPAQVEAVRARMERQIDRTLVAVLAYAGLRPGEALALTWADIGTTYVSVSKALSLGEIKTTKTGKSRRVPLIPALRSDLLQWRIASEHSAPGDPVFPNYAGSWWTEPDTRSWAGRRFKPALSAAGIEESVRTYDLRHSYCSMLIASGLNPVEVARRAGHSPAMTLTTYAHVFEEWEGKRIDLEQEVAEARQGGLAPSGPGR